MIVVVMGVSGAGKSTLGRQLAERLGYPFLDADEFHPPQNVAKMAAGTALTDEDRWPWLERLNEKLKGTENAVLACSALKQSYRDVLTRNLARHAFVFLKGGFELIQARLAERSHRYMPASLLKSQFATLEPPRDAIEVDIGGSVAECLAAIEARLASLGAQKA
jgi:carbohydrate kinase (thermoresistant glucokinase family)